MAPRRKRQRLSEDGASAVTALADPETLLNTHQQAAKNERRRQLFVRSLAPTVTTQALSDYFSESYPIKHALVVLDKGTKESRGFGFVTFADPEDAQRAKEELDNTDLQGKKIRVEVAESRHREAGGDDGASLGQTRAPLWQQHQQQQHKKDNQPPKLIVRNLPWSIKTPLQLEKLFQSFGKVHFAQLPKKRTGELRGFGIVGLRGQHNAEKAIVELNGREIYGRPIAVDWAVDTETWQSLQKADKEDTHQVKAGKAETEGSDAIEDSDATSSVLSESDESGEDGEEDQGEHQDDEVGETYLESAFDSDKEDSIQLKKSKPKRDEYTIFIRNLPFTADDDALYAHFTQFGPLRFARVVLDRETEKPKGTGFVCFQKENDMIDCLKGVPRTKLQHSTSDKKDGTSITVTHSVLEDEDADATGKYTMDGRILQISRAVERSEATRLTAESAALRFNRDKDKRRLYLLSEGTISSHSPLYQKLAPSEVKMREDSAAQRRRQIQENPSLHLSLTRLSVRNIPRSITSKDLKQLARQAIVGFAANVRAGKRQKLSKEEVSRGGEADFEAEKIRKKRGKGIVKQAKVVFENPTGSKIAEETGAGRSRGYGFIEYYTHRNALMGLRWLNGHALDYRVKIEIPKSKKADKEAQEDRKKRLIVEFAIENANVVSRRSERESKTRQHPKSAVNGEQHNENNGVATGSSALGDKARGSKKRKRDSSVSAVVTSASSGKLQKGGKGKVGQGSGSTVVGGEWSRQAETEAQDDEGGKDKLAHRSRIIAKKRQVRRAKRAGQS